MIVFHKTLIKYFNQNLHNTILLVMKIIIVQDWNIIGALNSDRFWRVLRTWKTRILNLSQTLDFTFTNYQSLPYRVD